MPVIDGHILDLTPSRVHSEIGWLGSAIDQVQFSAALSDEEYELVAAALRDHPQAHLRAYAAADSIADLEFLRFFPDIRSFTCDLPSVADLSGLAHLRPDLEWLSVGRTSRRVSLEPLQRFRSLKVLGLEGHVEDFAVVGKLSALVSLTLRSITLPDLSALLPLTKLRALDLKLGGTADLSQLPAIGQLEYLEIWRVRGLVDLSPIADLLRLQHLHLESLSLVEALPPMEGLDALREVWLQNLRGVRDLAPLASAPALRQLALVDMPHLQPDAVTPLVGHPSLERVRAGLGSTRKNDAVRALLGLPDADLRRPAWA